MHKHLVHRGLLVIRYQCKETEMTLDEFMTQWNDGNSRLLVHTSGSTGTPKPLWVEKSRMVASARITCSFLGLRHGDTALLCMPLDFIAGKMMVVRSIVGKLRLLSVQPSSHPLATLTEAPVFAAMVPLQVWNSLQVPEERDLLRQIHHLIIGGGAIDQSLEEELRHFPHAVWSTYGMTETLSHVALRRLSGSEASEWYSPLDGVTISVDSRGCLVVDAPRVCAHPLHTNDIVEMDAHGARFRIIGRIDNVVDSGGIKIQIEEVEQRLRPLLPYPFMIIKVSDKKFGEAMALLIQVQQHGCHDAESNNNNAHDAESKAMEICRSELPRYWQPAHYIAVPLLPLTDTGKPARAKAKALYCPD